MRQLLVLVALLLIAPRSAGATAQMPERILVNGRVLSMFATPLDSLLEGREDLKRVFRGMRTDLWRGYIGTWAVEGNRLYLVGIEQEDDKAPAAREPALRAVPLSLVFGEKVAAPVPASWFTGTLRVPLAGPRRYLHMGFGSQFGRELRLHVSRGMVQQEEKVDGIHEGRGRSREDMQWCAIGPAAQRAYPAPPADGWLDARRLVPGTPSLDVPRAEPFRTRGILHQDEQKRWTLWIPPTPVTEAVYLELRGIDALRIHSALPHVEVEVVWPTVEAEPSLDVRWVRPLAPGETIHDPAFPLPEVPTRPSELDAPPPVTVDSVEKVLTRRRGHLNAKLLGRLEVAPDGTTTLLGVDVAADPALEGQTVVATGSLAKYEISERLLKIQHPDLAPFRARGPGTYYRLLDPADDKLVVAKPESAPR